MNNFIKVLRDIKEGKLPLVKEWDLQDVIDLDMFVFKMNHGYSFDIHNPKTFSEKIQWYKFFYQREDIIQMTDKVLFKNYIARTLGPEYVIPMYGAWEDVKSFENDWNKFLCGVGKFVLKSNLQGRGLSFKVIEDKNKIDFPLLKNDMAKWLDPKNTLLNSCDWRFYDSRPMILAEEYKEDEYGELRDYKFFCFNGEVPFFRVDCSRFEKHQTFYFDSNSNLVKVSNYNNPPDFSNVVELPDTICEMFELSKKLSAGFPHVRVDFYSVYGKVYVSEMTFNSTGGLNPFNPRSFDELLGEYFILPG